MRTFFLCALLCTALMIPLTVNAKGVSTVSDSGVSSYRLHYDAYEQSPVIQRLQRCA
jgi:hypothetical protein